MLKQKTEITKFLQWTLFNNVILVLYRNDRIRSDDDIMQSHYFITILTNFGYFFLSKLIETKSNLNDEFKKKRKDKLHFITNEQNLLRNSFF